MTQHKTKIIGILGLLSLLIAAVGVGALALPEQTDLETHVQSGGENHLLCDAGEYSVLVVVEDEPLMYENCLGSKAEAQELAANYQSELKEMTEPAAKDRLWTLILPIVGFVGGVAFVGAVNRERDVRLTPSGTPTVTTLARFAGTALVVYVVLIVGAGIGNGLTQGATVYSGFWDQFTAGAILAALRGWVAALLVAGVMEVERHRN